MAGKRNWLMGCGVGCLALIVLTIIGGTLVWRSGKQVVSALDAVGDSQEALAQQYGALREYAPPSDGRLGADRLEIFLAVQTAIHEPGAELAGFIDVVSLLEEKKSIGPRNVITGIRSLMGLGHSVAAYLDARNSALLDHGMGLGEYSYLYVIVYHAGTGRELRPAFSMRDSGEMEPRLDRLRGHFKAWLTNQREAAASSNPAPGWLETLDNELARLTTGELHAPWRDGLPEATASSLEPYRVRMDEFYLPLGALLCIGADKSGEGFDFEIQ